MMYESASGERFTIYTAKSNAEATQMRFAAEGKESTLFWADDGVVYAVVSTGADRGRLTQIAQAVYDQMEKKSCLSAAYLSATDACCPIAPPFIRSAKKWRLQRQSLLSQF